MKALGLWVVAACLLLGEKARGFPLYVEIDEPQPHMPSVSARSHLTVGLVVSAEEESWEGLIECEVGIYFEDYLVFRKPHKHVYANQHSLISYRLDLSSGNFSAGTYTMMAAIWDKEGNQIPDSGESRQVNILSSAKKFIYMIQAYTEKDVSDRVSDDADVVQLIWGDPPLYKDPAWYQVYAPGTTANTGRNRVLEEAKKLGDYLYFIQCDDDARLVEVADFGKNTGNGWKTFEKYLIEWEPAVGFVRNEDKETIYDQEVQLQLHFDTIFTAYHREAIDWLMPLETRWDNVSWWYASCPLWLVARKFWNEHRIQFNAIKVWNDAHTEYPKVNNWTVPIQWMVPALKMPELQLIDFNLRVFPLEWLGGGVPKKKQGSYTPEDFTYDPCHPFFLDKRRNSVFLAGGGRALCEFPYHDDYLHYRREQEYIRFAERTAQRQADRAVWSTEAVCVAAPQCASCAMLCPLGGSVA